MNVLDTLGRGVVYLGLATLLTEAAAAGILWNKGWLQPHRITDVLSVLYNVDLVALRQAKTPPEEKNDLAPPSLDDVLESRRRYHLDLDLRELAIDQGNRELQELQVEIKTRRTAHQAAKNDFDARLAQLQQGGVKEELAEVRRRIEVLAPKQAKEQLLKILDDQELDADVALEDVVSIIKAMPLERRKKVLGEFKSDVEMDRLHQILGGLRAGTAESKLIQETRQKLDELEAPSS